MAASHTPSPLPELWAGETIVWSGAPTGFGAAFARFSHAFRRARDSLSGASELHEPGVVVAFVQAIGEWFAHSRQRHIRYVITTRRVVALYGPETDWLVYEHCRGARVSLFGNAHFLHDRDPDLDVRFTGLRHATVLIELAHRAAALSAGL